MVDRLGTSASMDLDALDDYLSSDHAPENSMGLSDLDGFLTGVVVSPELILPSEWLPVIWGGEQPEFKTEAEMQMVIGTIMGRYNEIVACFKNNSRKFDPVFWEGVEGEIIATDWAGGFLDAVALRPEEWKSLVEDDSAGMLLVPFLLLNGDLEFDSAVDFVSMDEFLEEAPDMISTCVFGIHDFWSSNHRKHRGKPGNRNRRSIRRR